MTSGSDPGNFLNSTLKPLESKFQRAQMHNARIHLVWNSGDEYENNIKQF